MPFGEHMYAPLLNVHFSEQLGSQAGVSLALVDSKQLSQGNVQTYFFSSVHLRAAAAPQPLLPLLSVCPLCGCKL